jgi:hypothetical protein
MYPHYSVDKLLLCQILYYQWVQRSCCLATLEFQVGAPWLVDKRNQIEVLKFHILSVEGYLLLAVILDEKHFWKEK